MIRLIVADDHALVRAGICSLLKSQGDIVIVAETGSGREAVNLCHQLKPDIILLDLSMPDMDGLEATKQILVDLPEIKVIILTMYENEEYATRVLSAGAKGFIVKRMSPEELPSVIRKVMSGETCITARTAYTYCLLPEWTMTWLPHHKRFRPTNGPGLP